MLHWDTMRRARFRCPLLLATCVLAVVFGTCLSLLPFFSGSALAEAAVVPLSVSVNRPLSLTGEELRVSVAGRSLGQLVDTRLVIRLKGPAEPSQVGQSNPEIPDAGKIAVDLAAVPTTTIYTVPGESLVAEPAASTEGADSVTTTTVAPRVGSLGDLRAGVLEAAVTIPNRFLQRPGAYLLVAEVKAAGEVIASGRVWMGRAAPRETPLDLAFIWPVALGIHRNAEGVFFDQVLEQAVSEVDGDGGLRGVIGLAEHFPDWRFTLAPEPVLLTQLRDMADGYTRISEDGDSVEVPSDARPARDAAELVKGLRGLAERRRVELLVGPYSGADLGVLAAEGWRDGLQQLQLGKQELQQGLGLAEPLQGGYPPDLALTSDGLSYYAQASIDHVVVADTLTTLLTEPITAGTVSVRARNTNNDRLTLVFAHSRLSARLTSPWDPGVFVAALAAELATNAVGAMVVTPNIGFTLVPVVYLEAIGRILEGVEWVRTQTLSDLLNAHGPDTRPVHLKTSVVVPGGYIEESLLADLRVAHGAVGRLVAIADPTRTPVEEVLRLLFIAQSRYWSRAETSPQEATIGMAYAEKAKEMAQRELDRIRFWDSRPGSIMGSQGTVGVVVQNDAGYPLTVMLELEAVGMSLPEGELRRVEIAPGRTEIPVRVVGHGGPYELRAALVAGDSALDKISYELRFVTITAVVPWAGAGIVILLLILFLIVYRSKRNRRRAKAA